MRGGVPKSEPMPKALQKRFIEDVAAARALRSLARWARRQGRNAERDDYQHVGLAMASHEALRRAKKLEGQS